MDVIEGFILNKQESEYDFTHDIQQAIAVARMNGMAEETMISYLLYTLNDLNTDLWEGAEDGE